MSVYLYDEALVERLREVTGDSRIHIVPPEQSVSFLAQFDKDKVEYPAIVLSRVSPVTILGSLFNQVSFLKGQTVRLNGDENTVSKIKLLPIRIEWNIDVYAVDRYTCDEIVRELVFYLMSNSRFKVKVPYGLDVDQNFDIFVSPEISDNSDLIEFPNTGEFFRETISVYTENAHLYSSHRQYLTRVSPDVDVANRDKSK